MVGTAGHVDHGKSSLVLALTGTDPDRLKEEKERGVTTDIGFAHLSLPSGATVSFVDVPGHELFVKNMVAGAHGIDAVLLVVAANESVMPQTREHLAICGFLGVRRGLVALTKSDLVAAESLALVRSEIESFVAGSFLEAAPVVAVSTSTGAGLDVLRRELVHLAASPPPRDDSGLLRLPVDRVFTLRGFGTVVTGTLLGGTLRTGEVVVVAPAGRRSRVRGLHVHGRPVDSVTAGSRAAVNLADVGVGDLSRGDVLIREATLPSTSIVDAELTLLPSAPPLKDGTRVRLHAASAEVLGRVRFLDRPSAEPGSRAPLQLRLERPIVAVRGDRLVVRRYSPASTIAGLVVLDPRPPKRRTADAPRLAKLAGLVIDDVGGYAAFALEEAGPRGIAAADLAACLGVRTEVLARDLAAHAGIVDLDGRWIGRDTLLSLESLLLGEVDRFHRDVPLREGITRPQLSDRLSGRMAPPVLQPIVDRLVACGGLVQDGDRLRRPGHAVRLSPEEARRRDLLEDAARRAGLAGLTEDDLPRLLGTDEAAARSLCRLLVDTGTLRKLDSGVLVMTEHLETLKAAVRGLVSPGGRLDVAQVKAMTGLSRKYAIPLLEFLDRERVTRRIGAERIVL